MIQVTNKIYEGIRLTQIGEGDIPYTFEHEEINNNVTFVVRTKIQDSICESPHLYSLIQNVHARTKFRFKREEYGTSK